MDSGRDRFAARKSIRTSLIRLKGGLAFLPLSLL